MVCDEKGTVGYKPIYSSWKITIYLVRRMICRESYADDSGTDPLHVSRRENIYESDEKLYERIDGR